MPSGDKSDGARKTFDVMFRLVRSEKSHTSLLNSGGKSGQAGAGLPVAVTPPTSPLRTAVGELAPFGRRRRLSRRATSRVALEQALQFTEKRTRQAGLEQDDVCSRPAGAFKLV